MNPKINSENFKYIYGPVSSWRLGSSLGIDLLSGAERICSFDCVYCQLGRMSTYRLERKEYVSSDAIMAELKRLPKVVVDYITFSGRGEPTLAENLGQVIKKIKQIRKEPVAVLTNSSLLERKDVRQDLSCADFVSLKLDACSQDSFDKINNPAKEVKFDSIIEGIKEFRKEFRGRLAIQIMFIEENKNNLEELISLALAIKPDEIQINTPLRLSDVKPLSKDELSEIKKKFSSECSSLFGEGSVKVISVYDSGRDKKITSISSKDTLRRRGKRE